MLILIMCHSWVTKSRPINCVFLHVTTKKKNIPLEFFSLDRKSVDVVVAPRKPPLSLFVDRFFKVQSLRDRAFCVVTSAQPIVSKLIEWLGVSGSSDLFGESPLPDASSSVSIGTSTLPSTLLSLLRPDFLELTDLAYFEGSNLWRVKNTLTN